MAIPEGDFAGMFCSNPFPTPKGTANLPTPKKKMKRAASAKRCGYYPPVQLDKLDEQMHDEVEVVCKFLRNHRSNLGRFPFFRKCLHLESILKRYVTVHFMYLEQEIFYKMHDKRDQNSDYIRHLLTSCLSLLECVQTLICEAMRCLKLWVELGHLTKYCSLLICCCSRLYILSERKHLQLKDTLHQFRTDEVYRLMRKLPPQEKKKIEKQNVHETNEKKLQKTTNLFSDEEEEKERIKIIKDSKLGEAKDLGMEVNPDNEKSQNMRKRRRMQRKYSSVKLIN